MRLSRGYTGKRNSTSKDQEVEVFLVHLGESTGMRPVAGAHPARKQVADEVRGFDKKFDLVCVT